MSGDFTSLSRFLIDLLDSNTNTLSLYSRGVHLRLLNKLIEEWKA